MMPDTIKFCRECRTFSEVHVAQKKCPKCQEKALIIINDSSFKRAVEINQLLNESASEILEFDIVDPEKKDDPVLKKKLGDVFLDSVEFGFRIKLQLMRMEKDRIIYFLRAIRGHIKPELSSLFPPPLSPTSLTQEDMILEIFNNNPQTQISIKQLINKTGIYHNTVSKILTRLIKKGTVLRSRRGMYITSKGELTKQ